MPSPLDYRYDAARRAERAEAEAAVAAAAAKTAAARASATAAGAGGDGVGGRGEGEGEGEGDLGVAAAAAVETAARGALTALMNRSHRGPDMVAIASRHEVWTALLLAGDFISVPVRWPHAVCTSEASVGVSGYGVVPNDPGPPATTVPGSDY